MRSRFPVVVALLGAMICVAGLPGKGVSLTRRQEPIPVAWWKADNDTRDELGRANGTVHAGVRFGEGVHGSAFIFDGTPTGGISIPDVSPLHITGSMTMDVWVRVDAFPSPAKRAAMILFRGDRRDAYDPYYLSVLSSGKIRWAIDQSDTRRVAVDATAGGPVSGSSVPTNIGLEAVIKPNRWTHVTATLNDDTGEMRLYLNGVLAAHQTTPIRPLSELEPDQSPGIAIGNHSGLPHPRTDYAFVGGVDDLKIYNAVVLPEEAER